MKFRNIEKNGWAWWLILCNPTRMLSQEDCHEFEASLSKSETVLKAKAEDSQYRAEGNQTVKQVATKDRIAYKEIKAWNIIISSPPNTGPGRHWAKFFKRLKRFIN